MWVNGATYWTAPYTHIVCQYLRYSNMETVFRYTYTKTDPTSSWVSVLSRFSDWLLQNLLRNIWQSSKCTIPPLSPANLEGFFFYYIEFKYINWSGYCVSRRWVCERKCHSGTPLSVIAGACHQDQCIECSSPEKSAAGVPVTAKRIVVMLGVCDGVLTVRKKSQRWHLRGGWIFTH